MLYHEVPCPECEGWGHISHSSENSIWCEQCINCRGTGLIYTPMTNGEIIRTCSNEELVKVYYNLQTWAIYSGGKNNRLLNDTPEDFLIWINKEADDIDMETIFDFIDEKNYWNPDITAISK